jgi:hypothetical protein
MRRDLETDKQLQAMGWTVMRFWGGDIEGDVSACVEDVKNAILQTVIDSCEGPDGDHVALYGEIDGAYGVLAVAESQGEMERKP